MNIKAILIGIITLSIIGIVSCSQSGESDAVAGDITYDTPFDYCKSVKNSDLPGPEYTGPKLPDVIAQQLRKDMGVSDNMPEEMFNDGTYWRCMDGGVYACNVGANLPCQERAEMSKEPNKGMLNYCGENPDAEIIPMYASGKATVYEWKCDNGTPEIVKQIAETDKNGYIKDIWYKITP